jgi:hypothetical protein
MNNPATSPNSIICKSFIEKIQASLINCFAYS